jgi:hypothetical protein
MAADKATTAMEIAALACVVFKYLFVETAIGFAEIAQS